MQTFTSSMFMVFFGVPLQASIGDSFIFHALITEQNISSEISGQCYPGGNHSEL